jgi:hypothetical protein
VLCHPLLNSAAACIIARKGLSRRIMTKLLSALFTHDPVVERVVCGYMDYDAHDASSSAHLLAGVFIGVSDLNIVALIDEEEQCPP